MAEIVRLRRFEYTDQGTFGCLLHRGEFLGFTLEPPWRNNEPNRSCIPVDSYDCHWHRSPRYGWCYIIGGVVNRSNVLVHSGNYGGDTELGFKTHTKGCILLGRKQGFLGKQKAVLISKPTVRAFMKRMDEQPFKLNVEA
jgi:hypothetical protein